MSTIVFRAKVYAGTEEEARDKAKGAFFKENIPLVNGSFHIEVSMLGDGLFMCDFYNRYFVELLSFKDCLLNFIRIANAATLNVGNVPAVVVIE